ncbi:heme-binding protein [Fulvimarina sp. 2208YS6-2-32]|uniref:Heme-binding protein n=1 Tax=Fulvimarina uroteuthidis TaxID=3098149 RepID=A0ABU5I4W3_9HYPH|nr:heme-binding protein [Fulvimarina sp. 2208YS6-2-32]MDY8110246.1 heme-binding protein [Fulvimarina sp. 2208YS6-2-32]
MTNYTRQARILTHQGAMAMLSAAIDKADEIGQPQCIVVVDASGEVVAEVRMTGAKFLSRKSAATKARTAASNRGASGDVPAAMRPHLEMATQLSVTGLPGGLPIKFDGEVVGGIGVGSGTGDQDLEVGRAGLAAIGADAV